MFTSVEFKDKILTELVEKSNHFSKSLMASCFTDKYKKLVLVKCTYFFQRDQ